MVAQVNNGSEEQPWFADSGANTHITNDLKMGKRHFAPPDLSTLWQYTPQCTKI
jgi:hypothetical protein